MSNLEPKLFQTCFELTSDIGPVLRFFVNGAPASDYLATVSECALQLEVVY